MSVCLTDHDLEAFVGQGASEQELSAWSVHLESCDTCAARLGRKQNALSGAAAGGDSKQQPKADPDETITVKPPVAAALDAGAGLPEDAIPGYRILKELHRGGQGVVYQAVQEAAKRKVALKVMLEGPFASKDAKRRFEREIALVGSLRHPGIVPIFDSGVAQGRFYYAMEYIRGERLNEYVQSRKLSVDDTLRLFKKVCDAVDYAHQKGVIHRDLKPSNILVDPDGGPHVLDFGLAKVGGAEVGDTLVSVTGQVMGTPAYMSPEQAAGQPDRVDMRSDVYALGVILYELLTGEFPYEVGGQMADTLRTIQEVEPRRPSTIRRQINDEVETILLKCLAKEKERRYFTAGALAADITHYLTGEPIEAKRDSALYVLRKTLRRYRLPAAIAAVLVVVISTALVVSLSLWRRATSERDRAVSAETTAKQAQAAEAIARAASEENATALRQQLYTSYISRADAALQRNNAAAMRVALENCSEDLRHWEWYRLHSLLDQSRLTLRGHAGAVGSVAYSSDDRWILSSRSADRTIRLWDAVAGRMVWSRDEPAGLGPAVFTSDDREIITATTDGRVAIWDAATGKPIRQFPGDGVGISIIQLDPNGECLWTVSQDAAVRRLDLETGAVLNAFGQKERIFQPIWLFRLHPDGRRFLVPDRHFGLAVHNAATGQRIGKPIPSPILFHATFSPDGERILWGGSRLELCDASSGEPLRLYHGHTATTSAAAFSPDGSRIVSCGLDHTVRLWDVATGRELAVFRGHTDSVESVAFSANGSRVVSSSRDGTVKIWDAGPVVDSVALRGHENWVRAVAFSPDGRQLASASTDGTVKLWDLTNWRLLHTLSANAEWALGVAYSRGGSTVVAGYMNDTIGLWDAVTGEDRGTLRGHTSAIWWTTVSPDGSRIASGSVGGSIILWDGDTGAQLRTLGGQHGAIEGLAFAPDGRRLAACHIGDRTVKLWSVETGELIETLRGLEGRPRGVAFSPTEERIAAGDYSAMIRVWDIGTSEPAMHLRGHAGPVTSVAYSPDGKRIFSGSQDNTVKVWNAQTGEELLTLRGHDDAVFSVAVSPDGRSVASGSNDKTVRLWTINRDADFGARARLTTETLRRTLTTRSTGSAP